MILRSLLFIPGDSEKKLSKGESVPADALILDLEDSVVAERKTAARELVTNFLGHRGSERYGTLWVRINPLTTAEASADLASIMAGSPDGIVLPKTSSADDVLQLGMELDELERRLGLEQGATKIMPISTETPASLFAMGGYARPQPRLAAITWGAEDLSLALSARSNVDAAGEWLFPYQLARSLCLVAAHAAGVLAIDTVYTRLRDTDGLVQRASHARRDGFSGKLAIHPDQVEIINEAFAPTADEIDYATEVVEAFNASPTRGVIALDGRMLDLPHLQRAQRVLALADGIQERWKN